MDHVEIIYKTAAGKEICVTVTVEVKELLAQSDRQIQSQRRQDRRRHTEYIDGLTFTTMVDSPADLLEKMEQRQRLHAAMQTLTEKQRRRLILHFFHALSYRKIAKLENVSDRSVTDSVRQALNRLRKQLDTE